MPFWWMNEPSLRILGGSYIVYASMTDEKSLLVEAFLYETWTALSEEERVIVGAETI